MRKLLIVSLVAGAVSLGLTVSRATSAPPPAENPVRWEHARLVESVYGRATWVTAKDEIEVEHMKELAERLKAPPGKQDGSSAHHHMRVMDKLSADGWEVVESPTLNCKDPVGGAYIWSFRRRLP
jgi:hypothetical protein